jgi:RNA polymerase sigma-70 factor (ECF subfamily)
LQLGSRMTEFDTSVQTWKQGGDRVATNGNQRSYRRGEASESDACAVNNSEINPESRLRLFEEIILPHLNAGYNLARWLTRNEHDAQDVVQEAYLRAFRFFDSYKGGDGKAWLLEIVRNTCFTWRRREMRNLTTVVFDEAAHTSSMRPNQEEALVDAANRTILQNCIERLPEAFREVLVMRDLEEMSYRQIGKVAGVPVGTVMSRLSRARKRLEECVSGRNMESDQ